jgi:hypothetical protein
VHKCSASAKRDLGSLLECSALVDQLMMCTQMSDSDRSRMASPFARITYAAREISTAGEFDTQLGFYMRYLNSSAAKDAFWQAWQICMGVFLALGGLVAAFRWYKWSVRFCPSCMNCQRQ